MNAVAERGKREEYASKHQIHPEYGYVENERTDAGRGGTGRPNLSRRPNSQARTGTGGTSFSLLS